MFDEGAVYTSSAVGDFEGRKTIGEMMQGFFARYPNVHWQAQHYRYNDNSVTFDFIMKATEANSGNSLERQGVEQIEFSPQGLIIRLIVDAT